jgi:hypothetical protein
MWWRRFDTDARRRFLGNRECCVKFRRGGRAHFRLNQLDRLNSPTRGSVSQCSVAGYNCCVQQYAVDVPDCAATVRVWRQNEVRSAAGLRCRRHTARRRSESSSSITRRRSSGETAVFLDRAQRNMLIAAAEPVAGDFLPEMELTAARPIELSVAKVADFDDETLRLAHRKGRPPKLTVRHVVLSDEGVQFFKRRCKDRAPGAQVAASFKFEQCYAETIHEMAPAIRFYAMNGFRRLANPPGNAGHSHDDCWMLLDL